MDRASGLTSLTPGAGPGVWHERLAARGRRRGSVRLHRARDIVRGGTRTRRNARRGVPQKVNITATATFVSLRSLREL